MWERFKWLFVTGLKFKRTSYPRTRWGVRACLAALGTGLLSIGVINVKFETGYVIDTLSLADKEPSLYAMYLSAALFILGAMLIFSEWNQKLRLTARVIISAMPGVSTDFPEEMLEPSEKAFCREPVHLGVPSSIPENIEQQVRRYNAELEVDIFKRHILQDKGQKLYIGGLARIPFLVAYGAMLRNLSAEIVYFDKLHKNGSYALLSDENTEVRLKEPSLVDKLNDSGAAAIALGLSTPINLSQIPKDFQNSTIILDSEQDASRNLIKNQGNLQEMSAKVGEIIDRLSALPGCKKIHLFLSVQSALAIEIGRRYQEGTQQNWVIHNFDPSSQSYTWAIELSRSGISVYS
ncbi:SAVED domain-containing protein [Shewanella sp. Isolate8]|uniref:SAVED domain-containing protein n=1 Tax=Shewanella sp. Isolate8 TaxID=2908529 RepID=UPI001EFE3038|nr:SAVED domain-containing protein [Shewanella sp. Isolate8]MCG9745988.1 SAVED domain-containing protein [Shewanella sp. Isolate8]